jgi:predicted DNA-binding protein (MmcQ/YjbR family)
MTIDHIRAFCRSLAGTTEDVKWGYDLAFSVGGKMYTVVCLEPPHTVAFKCSPDVFAELVERDGIIPAPYLARAMWVQEQAIGESLGRAELEQLVRASYELVGAKLPKSKKPGATTAPATPKRRVRQARTKSR